MKIGMTKAGRSGEQATRGVKVESRIKAGALSFNHNQATRGIKVKSRIKAGALSFNHNQSTKRRLALDP